MKRSEAPVPGWYPDPVGGVRLRWWDGTDWADRYRARPGLGELALARLAEEQEQRADAAIGRTAQQHLAGRGAAGAPLDAERLIAEVQRVARAEVDRAADVFGQRAQRVVRDIQPLVTQYGNRAIRWLRLAVVFAALLLVGWVVFKVVLEVSLMEWIGDRIDNLTN